MESRNLRIASRQLLSYAPPAGAYGLNVQLMGQLGALRNQRGRGLTRQIARLGAAKNLGGAIVTVKHTQLTIAIMDSATILKNRI